jgi:hypothetical protein
LLKIAATSRTPRATADIDRKYFRKLMRKYDIEGPRDEPADDDE